MPRRGCAVVALLLGLALPASASAAVKPGVFAGTVGASVPKGAQATVHAIEVTGGTVVAARDVGRSGAFSLRLPPGPYIVRGTVVPRRGRAVTASSAVSLKPGQRRARTRLTRRNPKRSGRAAFVTERGNVRLGTVATGIYQFAGPSGGDLGGFVAGISDLLIGDVLGEVGERCKGRVALREVTRLTELLREFELGKSRYADKSTFPERNLIVLDVAVRGRITQGSDGTARAAVTITDSRTGESLGALDVSLGQDLFAGEQRLAGQLAEKLCKLSESFEVTLAASGEGRFATHQATGTMRAVLLARRSGDTWSASGPLRWENVAFTSKVDCPYIDLVVPQITWTVTISDRGDGLSLAWSPDANDATTGSIDCPPDGPGSPDPPPIPGQPGTSLINAGPRTFPLPYAGATTPISGVVESDGDGFFTTGTITVKPAGIVAPD